MRRPNNRSRQMERPKAGGAELFISKKAGFSSGPGPKIVPDRGCCNTAPSGPEPERVTTMNTHEGSSFASTKRAPFTGQ